MLPSAALRCLLSALKTIRVPALGAQNAGLGTGACGESGCFGFGCRCRLVSGSWCFLVWLARVGIFLLPLFSRTVPNPAKSDANLNAFPL